MQHDGLKGTVGAGLVLIFIVGRVRLRIQGIDAGLGPELDRLLDVVRSSLDPVYIGCRDRPDIGHSACVG